MGLEVGDIVFADGESLDLDFLKSCPLVDADDMHSSSGKACSLVPVRYSCCENMPF